LNRLRTRLMLVFAVATLAPLAATLWITTSLLEHTLSLAATRELDQVSRSLEAAGRALYQASRESLRFEAESGRAKPRVFAAAEASTWPDDVREFAGSDDSRQFRLTGERGDVIAFYVRRGGDVLVYEKPVGGPGMHRLAAEHANARAVVYRAATRDFRKGLFRTLAVLAAAVWVISLAVLVVWANRITRPIAQLTAGLSQLADGKLDARLNARGADEVGRAMHAFNHMAEQLERSRERLVHVTRLASWQTLARKMAHEVKNSLTPIRLTMEEVIARKGERDEAFIDQAAQIVVDEAGILERRVRAFSDFASEPPVKVATVDLDALLDERIALLRSANPGVEYERAGEGGRAVAQADPDLIRGVLTNLLENAAYAAGAGGRVRSKTVVENGKVAVEVHDSGPGLSEHARETLFEPTISFKKSGMGLGLSIAKRSALMVGGDILLVEGELGGAGFRVELPRALANGQASTDR
jgi:nitrogen fixation/metabolism regulation signal transduction histidine kinase